MIITKIMQILILISFPTSYFLHPHYPSLGVYSLPWWAVFTLLSISLSYDYVSRPARSYLWLQCTVYVSNDLLRCLQHSVYVLQKLSIFLWALRLTGAINDFSELFMCSLSYLWLRRATKKICVFREISVSSMNNLCLQRVTCFSSELSMSPIRFLCPQWTINVSNELSMSPVSCLCI